MRRRSRNALLACAVIFAGLDAASSHAQDILKVSYSQAAFHWDVPAPGPNQSPADKHTIVCGSVTKDVLMPATSIPVKEVVSATGVYSCSIFASNTFGRQVEPNVPFPQFEAGLEPASPLNPRLEVR